MSEQDNNFNQDEDEIGDFLDSLNDGGIDNSDTEIEVFRGRLFDEVRPLMERWPNQRISKSELGGTIKLNNPALPPEEN